MDFNHNQMIYMDYQASTPVDKRVMEAMIPYFFDKYANPHSADHAYGWEANEAVEKSRELIAENLEIAEDELFFTSGATESNNLAILGLAEYFSSNKHEKRNKILVSSIEHKSVLDTAYAAQKKFSYEVVVIPVERDGKINLHEFKSFLNDDILLVSIGHTNSEIGVIQDIPTISELCKRYGSYIHTDATQALPLINQTVESLGVDMLSFSGHKIYGPKGIGGLYLSREIQDKITPRFYGGGQQNSIRPGTIPVPLSVGLCKAIEIAVRSELNIENVKQLRDSFFTELVKLIPSVDLNGPSFDKRHHGNLNVRFSRIDAHNLLSIIQPKVAASLGSACSSGEIKGSHVLYALGLNTDEVKSSLRFSLGRFTTEEEVRATVAIISEAVSKINSF